MSRYRVAAELLDKMTKENIVIAPWLAGDSGTQRIGEEQEQILEKSVTTIVRSVPESELQISHSSFVVTQEFARAAFREILMSTALYLGHIKLGTLVLSDEMIVVAQRMISNFGRTHGLHELLNMYTMIVAFENCQALTFYGQMDKDIFLSGQWHRPWVNYPLDYELAYCCENGWIQEANVGDSVMLELTEAGQSIYAEARKSLEAAGYLSLRAKLLRISGFTFLEDYDEIIDTIWPMSHTMRQDLVSWSEIHPGMNILELGCGTGTLTFEDGLIKAVGETGTITAIDPAAGMLERAKAKGSLASATNVTFRQSQAESLPFEDNMFDAVIGAAFLHFTNAVEVFEEIHRVAKPGALFATFYPIRVEAKDAEFLLDWFAPVYRRLSKENAVATNVLRDSQDIPNLLGDGFQLVEVADRPIQTNFNSPADTVKFYIEVINLFEGAMDDLPWKARRDLIEELVDKGHRIIAEHGGDFVGYDQVSQWLKIRVKK